MRCDAFADVPLLWHVLQRTKQDGAAHAEDVIADGTSGPADRRQAVQQHAKNVRCPAECVIVNACVNAVHHGIGCLGYTYGS